MSDLEKGRVEFTDPTQTSFRPDTKYFVVRSTLSNGPPPLVLTPDGVPDGWCIYFEDGVPVLARAKPANQNTVTYRPQAEEQ